MTIEKAMFILRHGSAEGEHKYFEAVDVIEKEYNRQRAEVERLQKLQKPTETSGFIVENNRIVFYTNILNGYRHEYITINEIARELNGLLHAAYKNDEVLSHYKGKLQTAKTEAIKEFAERLKECRVIQTANMSGYIDNLVKEMTEREGGQ